MDPQKYPAAIGYVLNIVMAVIVSFNFLSPGTAKVISTVVVAATSLAVVFLVHPFAVAAMTGAFQTFLVALGGFGFHLSDDKIAGLVALAALAASVILHHFGTPQVAHRQGTTVEAMTAVPAGARRMANL